MANHPGIQARLPRLLRAHVLHFETAIENAVLAFSGALPEGARVLDAGAGEGQYKGRFSRFRYTGVDLGVGDNAWNYGSLDAVSDLSALPFADASFDACINIVTLEHLKEPLAALREMGRVLKPGGKLLLIAPHEWEVHQAPHDYFRYTRHGLEHLLSQSGFDRLDIQPVGGYFRLLSRRLFNGLQFFPGLLAIPAALLLVPPALLLPVFDGMDREKNFTLGYICFAARQSVSS
ncbi:MAG TPA: class I SAM-dependent methyltransferase [Bryobacteraceae bacterium]|jgi:SAM-dependent methyltransferase|nr:class I SAM-dependent methyltransferase [Bryobacteraceae bacterium]